MPALVLPSVGSGCALVGLPVWAAARPAGSGAGSAPGALPRPPGPASPWELSMSGAALPDTQDPAGAGTCPEDVPSLKELEQLLNSGRPSCNHVDEVWPNLFLGDLWVQPCGHTSAAPSVRVPHGCGFRQLTALLIAVIYTADSTISEIQLWLSWYSLLD